MEEKIKKMIADIFGNETLITIEEVGYLHLYHLYDGYNLVFNENYEFVGVNPKDNMTIIGLSDLKRIERFRKEIKK